MQFGIDEPTETSLPGGQTLSVGSADTSATPSEACRDGAAIPLEELGRTKAEAIATDKNNAVEGASTAA